MLEHENTSPFRGQRLLEVTQRLIQSPYLLLTLAPLFWSGNFVLGRAVAGDVPPVGLAFWRWFAAAAIIGSVTRRHLRRDWPVIRSHGRALLLLALLGVAVFNTFIYMGLRSTTAVNGVLMQSTMPVWIVALSFLFFRERVTGRQTMGMLVSLAGALTIVARGEIAALLALRLNHGDTLILAAVASYAAYSTLLRHRPRIHPLSFLAVTFTAGALLLLPFYVWEHLAIQAVPLRVTTLLTVGYIAIFPSILAFLCYNRGVELVGANRAGLFIHLMPVFGSLLAVLFLGETLQGFHGLGVALILCGIVLATRARA
jgi:drug/metabolite transporter (DMT)-like permease